MTGWAAHVYAACQVSCRKPPMGHAALKLPKTGAEFLVWDESQTVKHEFIHGEVVPWGGSGGSSDILGMAGAGDAHVTVALNVAMQLRQHLAGSPCRSLPHAAVVAGISAGGHQDPVLRPGPQRRRRPVGAAPFGSRARRGLGFGSA